MLVIFYQGFWGHHSCSVGTSVLPSCGPRFESQAHHQSFSHSQILYYIFHCVEERTKKTIKRLFEPNCSPVFTNVRDLLGLFINLLSVFKPFAAKWQNPTICSHGSAKISEFRVTQYLSRLAKQYQTIKVLKPEEPKSALLLSRFGSLSQNNE